MIVHDQRAVLAQRLVDAGALAEIFGDAFIVVIADAIVETHRRLRHHAQAVLQSGKRHAGFGVHVDGAIDVRPGRKHAAMQGKARPVDA